MKNDETDEEQTINIDLAFWSYYITLGNNDLNNWPT